MVVSLCSYLFAFCRLRNVPARGILYHLYPSLIIIFIAQPLAILIAGSHYSFMQVDASCLIDDQSWLNQARRNDSDTGGLRAKRAKNLRPRPLDRWKTPLFYKLHNLVDKQMMIF